MVQELQRLLEELKMFEMPDLASQLWNTDETGFCTAVAPSHVLAQCGANTHVGDQVM